jgi:hypothetical protein
MLVHLSLAREFQGRIYATGNPQACFELGNGQSEMTLRIPLGTQCGTVQQVSAGGIIFLIVCLAFFLLVRSFLYIYSVVVLRGVIL